MSTIFTNPYTAGLNWQVLLDEITLAYYERLVAIKSTTAWAWKPYWMPGTIPWTSYYPGYVWRMVSPAWKPGHSYSVGNQVECGGSHWVSTINNNLGNTPTDAAYWIAAPSTITYWTPAKWHNTEHKPDYDNTEWWLPAGWDDVQSRMYWGGGTGGSEWGRQRYLKNLVTSFIDHINGPLNAGQDGFVYFTLATWQAAAGLNVSAVAGESFRRSTDNGATFSYGFMQAGDDIGPWIFEDLQKGFSALQWTLSSDISYEADGYGDREGDGFEYFDCPKALQEEIDNWNAASWSDPGEYSHVPWAGGYAVENQYTPGQRRFVGTRRTTAIHHAVIKPLYGVPTEIPHDMAFYLMGVGSWGTFLDFDGLGILEAKYTWFDEVNYNPSGFVSKHVGGTTNPIELLGGSCPIGVGWDYSWNITDTKAVVKWNFTNA